MHETPPSDEAQHEARFIAELFAQVRRPWITVVFALSCTAVFCYLLLTGANPMRIDAPRLIAAGALYGPLTLQGETWRLLSAWFLHGGLLHIGLNLFALWQAGGLTERLFGHRRFAMVLFGSGLAGSVASIWWKPGVLSVGASGAIFGLYGALLGFMLIERTVIPSGLTRALRSSALGFIGFSLFAGFSMPGIDNAAHLGGLLGGLVLGVALARPLQQPPQRRFYLRALAGSAVWAAVLWGLWQATQPAVDALRQQAQQRAETARLAQADEYLARRTAALVESMQRGEMHAEAARAVLEHELLPQWEALIASLKDDANAQVAAANEERLRYAEARRNSVLALGQAIRTQDPRWLDRAANYSLQAENISLSMKLREAMSQLPR